MERLTWNQILEKYPNMGVGLTSVEYRSNSSGIKSAVVSYTSDNTPKSEIMLMAVQGKVKYIYTGRDELHVGVIQ